MGYDFLRVPYALTENGAEVTPDRATKKEVYYCPECHTQLTFKNGNIVRPHFAHSIPSPECPLETEGWEHIAAKYLVYLTIKKLSDTSHQRPYIEQTCEVCKRDKIWRPLPNSVAKAEIEYHISTSKGDVIGDVVLLDKDDRVVCVVEIYNTHAVDSVKRFKLVNIPWMELKASDVLNNQYLWIVRQGDLNPYICHKCRDSEEKKIWRSLYTKQTYIYGCEKESGPQKAINLAECKRCTSYRGIKTTGYKEQHVLCYYRKHNELKAIIQETAKTKEPVKITLKERTLQTMTGSISISKNKLFLNGRPVPLKEIVDITRI